MNTEEDIRNDLLQEIICNSSKCAHCVYFHKEAKNEKKITSVFTPMLA